MTAQKVLFVAIQFLIIVIINGVCLASSSDGNNNSSIPLIIFLKTHIPEHWGMLFSPRVDINTPINQDEINDWQRKIKSELYCYGFDVSYNNQEVIVQNLPDEDRQFVDKICQKAENPPQESTTVSQNSTASPNQLQPVQQQSTGGFKIVSLQQLSPTISQDDNSKNTVESTNTLPKIKPTCETLIDGDLDFTSLQQIQDDPNCANMPLPLTESRIKVSSSENRLVNLQNDNNPTAIPDSQIFQADAGDYLSSTIAKWATKVGWSTSWELDYDIQIEFGATFVGNFDSVSKQLVQSVKHNDIPFSITLNKGNKVVKVHNDYN